MPSVFEEQFLTDHPGPSMREKERDVLSKIKGSHKLNKTINGHIYIYIYWEYKASLMAVFDVNQALSTSKYLQSQKKMCEDTVAISKLKASRCEKRAFCV